jgi:hypothetical protein
MKKLARKVTIFVAVLFVLMIPLVSITQALEFDPGGTIQQKTGLSNPEGGLKGTVVRIIQWALGFLGLVAVIFIIYGGFIWMTAAGNEEKVMQAKKTLTSAATGLVIILLAWALVTFVVKSVINVAG